MHKFTKDDSLNYKPEINKDDLEEKIETVWRKYGGKNSKNNEARVQFNFREEKEVSEEYEFGDDFEAGSDLSDDSSDDSPDDVPIKPIASSSSKKRNIDNGTNKNKKNNS